jgi:hypothetical protein
MFNFLFGGGGGGTLVLTPDTSGKKLAGFHTGASLSLTAGAKETVGDVMEKFNTYRGPEQQITKLWRTDGASLSFDTVVSGTMVAIVRSST